MSRPLRLCVGRPEVMFVNPDSHQGIEHWKDDAEVDDEGDIKGGMKEIVEFSRKLHRQMMLMVIREGKHHRQKGKRQFDDPRSKKGRSSWWWFFPDHHQIRKSKEKEGGERNARKERTEKVIRRAREGTEKVVRSWWKGEERFSLDMILTTDRLTKRH